MILKEFRNDFNEKLLDLFPKTEVDSFFFLLIEEYLGLQRIDFTLTPNFKIPKEKETLLTSALKRLQKEEPIQYIIGKTEFYGLPFFVNEHVLIPRPETEELVAWVLKEVVKLESKKVGKQESWKVTKSQSHKVTKSDFEVASTFLRQAQNDVLSDPISILDIGTGSGCIAISLKKHLPKAKVTAIDISDDALQIARRNATRNNVEIDFQSKDILNIKDLDEKFDVIVSNPPYVRELEKQEIKNNVLKNEPHLALFVNDTDPLIFYDKIADLAKKHLTQTGVLFFEINQYLGKEMILLLKEKGFKVVQLKKDLLGNDRMIKASL